MKCAFCGAELEEDALVCSACGNNIDGESSDGYGQASDFVSSIDDADSETSFAAGSENVNETAEDDGKEAASDSDYEKDGDADEMTEDGEQDGEPSAQEPQSGGSVLSGSNAKMTLAVVLLSAALFAVCGFLFIDRILSLTPSDARASTIRIVSQSEDITVKPGTPTEFFVDAEGTNLTYQWYVKKRGDQMWHLWKSHDDYKITSTANESWDGMQVYCMIVDNNRTAIASEIVTVTIEK